MSKRVVAVLLGLPLALSSAAAGAAPGPVPTLPVLPPVLPAPGLPTPPVLPTPPGLPTAPGLRTPNLPAPPSPQAPSLNAALDPLTVAAVLRLTKPLEQITLPALPANPLEALVRAVNAQAARLGFGHDYAPELGRAGIPAEYAGRLALLVEATLGCTATATKSQRLGCAAATSDAAAGLVRTKAAAFKDVDAWPVLYVDGDGGENSYRNDYVVLVDRGGNDSYDNNAGGNLIDVNRGPQGSVATKKEPAIGCEQVQGNFPAPTATAHDCIAAPQVALVDYLDFGRSSNDTYGVLRAPRTVDHNPPATGPRKVDGDCTNEQLVRRLATDGSGFEGNGLLLDVQGNDHYLGKTASQGSGHVGGVGVLRDVGGGNDDYLAMRNSQGFSLVGVLGLLWDDGGNDYYHTYMPAPKDPKAAYQTDGSGGTVDDTGVCDNLSRMVQGSALAGGVGILLDQGGRDRYEGAPAAQQQFNPQVQFFHSSQGFGCDGGIGTLRDTGNGRDSYLFGPAGRQNGTSFIRPETTCQPAAPGISVFSDDG